ncbi:MAG: peptidylprolyl isomerase, partial [Candidatus Omnitrophica bacterium]|nr:peptidylprolyl isomerase [Candidatus Omnitrophota bacterium]
PELIGKIPRNALPTTMEFKEGMMVALPGPGGAQKPARVIKALDDFVVLDQNHPLAGKNLVYRVRVMRIA